MEYLKVMFFMLVIFQQGGEHGFKLKRSASIRLSPLVVLHMQASLFDSSKHSIKYYVVGPPEDPWKGVCLIDGHPVFGTDWELPLTGLDKAYLVVGSDTVNLDVSCMFNPWIDSADSKFFSLDDVEGGFVLTGNFSDGAGSYEAKWFISHGTSVRIELKKGEC